MCRTLFKLLWLPVLLVTMHYPLATELLAHAGYESSAPAADETVSQGPQQVQVRFSQELFRREGSNSLEVYGPGGVRVDLDDSAIDDDDRKLMTVSLQPDLANGEYTVRWRTLSADDGDEADGEFRFTVLAASPTQEPGQPTQEPGQPTPTAAARPGETAPEASPSAGSAPAAGEDAPGPASPGAGLPCMGSSLPVFLLLGALTLRRRRGKKG